MPADDDAASGPPPHPLDRVWLHPTELGGPGRSGGPGAPGAPGGPAAGRSPSRTSWTVVALAFVLGAVSTTGVLAAAGMHLDDRRTATSGRSAAAVATLPDGVADLVAHASPGIVAVTLPGPDGTGPVAVASGVVVAAGRIVTTAHLVGGATSVGVVTSDGQVLTADVLGADPDTDLALLQAPGDLTPVEVVPDPRLRVGGPVVALRSPAASRSQVVTGVVSAVDVVRQGTDRVVVGLVTTDARTDPSYGGALLAPDGRLVGVLLGLGDAVPSDVVRDVVAQLAHGGRAYHGSLGVVGTDALERTRGGVRVVLVTPDGPAETAGIRRGDVVVEVAGRPVTTVGGLAAFVRRLRPGDPVEVLVDRGGTRVAVPVVLGTSPADAGPDGGVVS